MRDEYPGKREVVRKRLEAGLSRSVNGERDWFKQRLEFLDELSMGGKPPATPATAKPRPSKPAPLETAPLTSEELLGSARYLVSVGKESKLTPAQRRALKEAA